MDVNDASLNDRLQPLIAWLFKEPNPIAINTLLMMTGAVQPVFRLPYAPLDKDDREDGYQMIQELLEYDDFPGDQLEIMEDSDFVLL